MNKSIVVSLVLMSIVLGYCIPSIFAEHGVLVEEYNLGEITSSYQQELEVENSTDCVSPPTTNKPVQPGQRFRIIVANPSYCVLTDVVLSQSDYVEMQNNIGIFTVKDRTPVTESPTHDYCDLAKWIWDGTPQDYRDRVLKTERYNNIFPEYCYEKYPTYTVPEFGTISMIILVVAIISIIAVTAKSKVIPRF